MADPLLEALLAQGLKPQASHLQIPTGTLSPTRDSISDFKDNPEALQSVMAGRMQFSKPTPDMSKPSGWLQQAGDFLHGMVKGEVPTADAESPFAGGQPGPAHAVTMIPPLKLGAARAAGKDLVDKIASEGLSQTSVGLPIRTKEFYEWYQPTSMIEKLKKSIQGNHGYKPPLDAYGEPYAQYIKEVPVRLNTHPDPQLMEGIQVAQQRWPRLFAHISEVKQPDRMAEILAGGGLAGSRGYGNAPGMSQLAFSTNYNDPGTVAHELLHHADALTMGNDEMQKAYKFANSLPGGYATNSYEFRANNMGDRFKDILAAIKANGGEARPGGKNLRVPLDPAHKTLPFEK